MAWGNTTPWLRFVSRASAYVWLSLLRRHGAARAEEEPDQPGVESQPGHRHDDCNGRVGPAAETDEDGDGQRHHHGEHCCAQRKICRTTKAALDAGTGEQKHDGEGEIPESDNRGGESKKIADALPVAATLRRIDRRRSKEASSPDGGGRCRSSILRHGQGSWNRRSCARDSRRPSAAAIPITGIFPAAHSFRCARSW